MYDHLIHVSAVSAAILREAILGQNLKDDIVLNGRMVIENMNCKW
jgi:hypothetical protein